MARRQKAGTGVSANLPIELDPNFLRTFADQTLVMHLGRDIDISFLAVGGRLERIQRGRTDTDNDVMNLRPQLNEVARVRINPNGAAIMAMEILQGLIRSGVADKRAMIAAMEEIEEPAATSEDEPVAEEEPTEAPLGMTNED